MVSAKIDPDAVEMAQPLQLICISTAKAVPFRRRRNGTAFAVDMYILQNLVFHHHLQFDIITA
jgi:hypothetical protein